MRVALLTAGGFPFRRDALSTWCRLLVDGLDRHTFHLRTLTDRPSGTTLTRPLGPNVASAEAARLPVTSRRRTGRRDDDATAGAVLVCRGMLSGDAHAATMLSAGLRRLARVAADQPDPLRDVPLADVLLDAWRTSRAADHAVQRPVSPPLTAAEAATAAGLLRRACRPLGVRVPDVELVHSVGGTAALLAALGVHHREARPFLVTEARTPSAPRPGEERLAPGVRAVLRLFRQSVARAGYAEAALVAPISAYHQGWVIRHGGHPAKLVTVPAAADPQRLLPGPDLVGRPSLVWTGSRAGEQVRTVLEAFGAVLAAVPGTVLHLVAPENQRARLRAYADQAGLTNAVRIERPPADHRWAYTRAQVAIVAPGPDEPPQRAAEAMFAACAVVGVDVGPVAETLGDAGFVVPANDPVSLASACVTLLRDPAERLALGAAARRRALAHLTPGHLARAYQAIYEDAAAAPQHELELAIPAPRGTHDLGMDAWRVP